MYYGTQDPGKGPDNLLDAQGYADLQWLVYKNDAILLLKLILFMDFQQTATPTFPDWAANTNWYDAITRKVLLSES